MKRELPIVILLIAISGIGLAQVSSKAGKTAKIYVTNSGATTIDVECERFELNIADSSVNYFCWDVCYTSAISLSIGTLPIASNDTNKTFYASYDPGNGVGTSIIKYCFNVNGVLGDSACLTVSYNEGNPTDSLYGTIAIDPFVGIEFIPSTNKNEILDIHPNPAKNRAALNYSLKVNAKHGELIVRNVLGSQVYKVNLTGISGRVILPVGDFNNGVYFCTMVVDNEVFQTQRLVINH